MLWNNVMNAAYKPISEQEFAHLGEGAIAYVRKITSDDLKARFPGLPHLDSGLDLWAVFAANGQPMMVADEQAVAISAAVNRDLRPVSIN
jgi:hypothetical protein